MLAQTLDVNKASVQLIPIASFLFLKKWKSFFVEPLIALFWNSGVICPGFQSQDEFPWLCALLLVHNGITRFTSGATPAGILAASMAD